MRCSITLWQFAKRAQITFGAVASGNRSPFWSLCIRNLRIACKADHFSNIPLGELNSEKNKMEASLKICLYPRFLYPWRLIQLYNFQANLIWCDGTFKHWWRAKWISTIASHILYRFQYRKIKWGLLKKVWSKKMFSLKSMTKLEDLTVGSQVF
jgi:hypothetical protein